MRKGGIKSIAICWPTAIEKITIGDQKHIGQLQVNRRVCNILWIKVLCCSRRRSIMVDITQTATECATLTESDYTRHRALCTAAVAHHTIHIRSITMCDVNRIMENTGHTENERVSAGFFFFSLVHREQGELFTFNTHAISYYYHTKSLSLSVSYTHAAL
jgi:hypothetical protein